MRFHIFAQKLPETKSMKHHIHKMVINYERRLELQWADEILHVGWYFVHALRLLYTPLIKPSNVYVSVEKSKDIWIYKVLDVSWMNV